MALKTLKDVEQIGGFKVVRDRPDGMSWQDFGHLRHALPIRIIDDENIISFKIQDGPILQNSENGCQVDTLIEAAKIIIEGLNKQFPCRENSIAITKLEEALLWLLKRKLDRVARGVEGLNQQ